MESISVIEQYLEALHADQHRPRSVATLKAIRQDLYRFVRWWETTYHRSCDVDQIVERDIHAWVKARQVEDGVAPATINRALSALRGLCRWGLKTRRWEHDWMESIQDCPLGAPALRSLVHDGVDALLRAARTMPRSPLYERDLVILVLLAYTGARVQEVCDLQLRDVDPAGGTITIRSGKRGRMRRVPLHPDARSDLQTYLSKIRCPQGFPALGSDDEREFFLVGQDNDQVGHPLIPGVASRVVQRVLRRIGERAAAQMRLAAKREKQQHRRDELEDLAERLAHVTPHMLRHSLARRLLKTGAQLPEVQRLLGHSRLTTTVMYLTPSEDDLREAMFRAGI